MAKDRGKATITLDGTELCGNYWNAMGLADGQRIDDNMLWYTEAGVTTLDGPGSSMPQPGGKQRYELLDKDKRIAIGLNLAHKGPGSDYVEVVLELGGYTLAEWQGPLTAAVLPKQLGYVMSTDKTAKGAYVMATIKRGDTREQLQGISGTVTFETYDLGKQAFKGRYDAKVGPIAGLSAGGTEHAIAGTFDIRLLD